MAHLKQFLQENELNLSQRVLENVFEMFWFFFIHLKSYVDRKESWEVLHTVKNMWLQGNTSSLINLPSKKGLRKIRSDATY